MPKEIIFKYHERIKELSKLENEWNGEGSRAIDIKSMYVMTSIVNLIGNGGSIFPTSDGGLQIEFGDGENGYLEIEVLADKVEILYMTEKELKNIN